MEHRPRSLLVASAAEIREDAELLAKTAARGSANMLLTKSEQKHVAAYVDKFSKLDCCDQSQWENLVVHVGDNPAGGWTTWSAHSNALPTIRKSGSLYFAPAWRRHLTMMEMFLSMGYPSHPLAAEQSHLPETHLLNVYSPDFALSWFDWRRALGNSMHVAAVGAFAGAMLLCSRMNCHDFSCEEILSNMDVDADE